MNIPKNVHWIWLGSTVKQADLQAMLDFYQRNSGYKLHLWTDSKLHVNSAINGLPLTSHVSAELLPINIKLIKEFRYSTDPLLIQSFEALRREIFGFRLNYAAASDILRLMILYQYGGVYLDVDTRSHLYKLPPLVCGPSGVLIWCKNGIVSNALIASAVKSLFVTNALKFIVSEYLLSKPYSDNEPRYTTTWWGRRDPNPRTRVLATMSLSGPHMFFEQLKKLHLIDDKAEINQSDTFPYQYFEEPVGTAEWRNLFASALLW